MRIFNKVSVAGMAMTFMFGLLATPAVLFAATTPSLGAAAAFGVLANTFTNTTISNGTTIFGDAGYQTFSGQPVFISGATHINDAIYLQAGADQHTALSALDSQPCTFTFGGAVDLASDISHGPLGVYSPGVYCSPGAMSINGGGTIKLDGAGTFIFRPSGTLSTSDFSQATTTNGASACDIFWTPQTPPALSSTVLGSDTKFVGTVIQPVGPVNSDITVGGGTSWLGRALAFDWSVTTNPVIMKYVKITAPTCPVPPTPPATATLHVIKHLVNDDGGTTTASSFTLHVKGSGAMGISDVAGSPAAGNEAPGTPYTLSAGTYTVSENAATGYTSSFSGSCDSNGSVTLSAGDDKTCTITNNDIATPVVVSPPPVPPVEIVTTPTATSTITVVVATTTVSTQAPPVVTPKFPNAGFPPEEKSILWSIALLAGVIIFAVAYLAVVLKKREI